MLCRLAEMPVRRTCIALLVLVVVSLASCSQGWKKCHPAQGNILLDGSPLEGAEVWLFPTADDLLKTNPAVRPYGKTSKDGSFTLMTYVAGDGAPVGTFKARVICEKRVKGPAGEGGGDDDRGQKMNILPPKYGDPEASGLVVTIQAGHNVIPDFNLKK